MNTVPSSLGTLRLLGVSLLLAIMNSPASAAPADVLETVRPAAARAAAEAGQIPPERQRELRKIALYVRAQLEAGAKADLTFICTHNSRRSHLSQIWAQTAAAWYGIEGVRTWSGGTEATACNIRTVRALRRAGFSVSRSRGGDNPLYLVQFGETADPLPAFSKKYDAEGNPASGFAAIMTCSDADQNCPVVFGSSLRVAVPFVDPKASDGTPAEDSTYDERSAQIAREMFFVMSQVKA